MGKRGRERPIYLGKSERDEERERERVGVNERGECTLLLQKVNTGVEEFDVKKNQVGLPSAAAAASSSTFLPGNNPQSQRQEDLEGGESFRQINLYDIKHLEIEKG